MKILLKLIILIFLLPALSCGKVKKKNIGNFKSDYIQKSDSTKNTILTRFNIPDGFKRISSEKNSFAEFLQNLKLKPEGTLVKNYDGSIKEPRDVYVAVVDIDVGAQDLQQCADAVMRLRAEYLYLQNRFDDIHFNFTNGFKAEYSKWREGYRIIVNNNSTSWVKKFGESTSYEDFRNYLNIVFTYAGTLSLAKEVKPVELSKMQIGDIFIKGGSPGHAVIVVDLAVNEKSGEKIFLLAQSYMPAQDIQILKNPMNTALSPWYSINFGETLETPEWDFSKNQLKKF
ncbi:MAG: DUF4846 domain-containing protein [Ignavibacteriae bacterium]|nr:DUF4846 domain-containing protein [Ignavibacteriota bacterium]